MKVGRKKTPANIQTAEDVLIDMKHELNYDPFLKEYNKKISNIKKDRQEKLDLIGSIPAKRKQLNIVKRER